jgi:hypothetical protein
MKHRKYDCLPILAALGFSRSDAETLRRVSMTLHRWHELECGTSNGAIERDEKTGAPYWYNAKDRYRYRVVDRETGALKRLAKIMASHPALQSYVQGYPRGAALYILRAGDVPEGQNADAYYSRGVVVCQ